MKITNSKQSPTPKTQETQSNKETSWIRPSLTLIGKLRDIVQGAGGSKGDGQLGRTRIG